MNELSRVTTDRKWPEVVLGEILSDAEVYSDGDWVESKDQDPDGGVRLIQLADVGDGIYVDKSARFLTHEKAIELKCTFLKPGDVLVARMPEPLGRACIFPGDPKPAVTVVDVCVIRPNPQRVHKNWLTHTINSPEFRKRISGFVTGTTRQRISRGNLTKLAVPLPPLPEQRCIAAILDKADALRVKRRESIAKLDQLLQSAFLEMFGDPVTNPKGWPKIALTTLTSKIGSGATPKGGDSAYHDEGISFIRSMNVHDGRFRHRNLAFIDEKQAMKLSGVTVESGDVLLNITGASVARVCLVPDSVLPARVNQHVAIIRCCSGLSSVFLEHVLMSSSMKSTLLGAAGSGATREAITKKQIEELLVPVPPTVTQELFATFVDGVVKQRCLAANALNRIEGLFASLQTAAFSGEI